MPTRAIGDRLEIGANLYVVQGPSPAGSTWLVVPAPEGGWVNYAALTDLVGQKAKKYRTVCDHLGVPFVVVFASDLLNGHDAEGMRLEMHSVQNFAEATFSGSTGGVLLDQSLSFDDRKPTSFPPVVSDVLFLRLTIEQLSWSPIGNSAALRPVPPSLWAVDRISLEP